MTKAKLMDLVDKCFIDIEKDIEVNGDSYKDADK
tara:strand:- start:275 stop:376 length:102 start_codon:yes stop_codon:yes gene_type:complete